MTSSGGEVTQLLKDWANGEESAFNKLIPIVYAELRRIARRYMARESAGHTLQTSALVNEAYVKLLDQQSAEWQNRDHFFAVAARVMRNILIDHARRRDFAKRGAGARRVSLDESVLLTKDRAVELLALDEAMTRLSAVDARKVRIIELRFFGGLSIEETAEVMKISPVTVTREWRAARAWLHRAMSSGNHDHSE